MESIMIKIDLVTGFLGSGKTTFIRRYANYLIGKDLRIGIVENDYGAINVDALLMQGLPEDKCDVEMVIGGDPDCHRRRFRAKLISMGMLGYDRIIVEPSGIYDADEFFDVLNEEPLDRWYEAGSVIAIADATLPEDLSHESDYLLVSQVADAGKVVLSRAQEASPEDMARTVRHINRALGTFQCKRRFYLPENAGDARPSDILLIKDWSDFTDEDFETIAHAGVSHSAHVKIPVERRNAYDSLFAFHVHLTENELRDKVASLIHDPSCGHIIRVKGFVPDGGKWIEINANGENIETSRCDSGQEVLIIIGENINEEAVRTKYFSEVRKTVLEHHTEDN